MGWFIQDGGGLPVQLTERIKREFAAPDASAPSNKGSLRATQLMLMGLAVIVEHEVRKLHAGIEKRLSTIETKQDRIEAKSDRFNPLAYANAEFGKKSCAMQFADREVVLTTEVLPSDGRTLVTRATRIEKQEAATRELESEAAPRAANDLIAQQAHRCP